MKKIFLLLFAAALLISCSKDSDSIESGNSTLIADFSFEFETVNENDNIIFVNDSEGAVSYKWDFGNGVIVTSQNSEFQYQTHGVYNVTLTVENESGDIQSVTKSVNVLCVFGGGTGGDVHTF